MYLVDRDGDVVPLATLQNAHGGAMAIWRILAEKRLGIFGTQFTMLLMDGMRPIFQAAREGKFEPWETVTLMTTTDKVIVPTEHVASVASALQKFADEHGPEMEANNFVFHVGAQAKVLRDYVEQAEKEGWRGVCWNQMSVSESLWDGVRLTEEEQTLAVEEDGIGVSSKWEEDSRPYNVNKDNDGHWFWPETPKDVADVAALKEG